MKFKQFIFVVFCLSVFSFSAQAKNPVTTSFGIHVTTDPLGAPMSFGLHQTSDQGLVFGATLRTSNWFSSGIEAWWKPEADWRLMPFAFSPRIKLVSFNFFDTKNRVHLEPYLGYAYQGNLEDWFVIGGANLVYEIVSW